MWPLIFTIRLLEVAGSVAGGSGSGPVSAPASTPSPTPAEPTPASGAPSASPTGTPDGQQPTTPTQPADDLQDGNWRELRSRYEAQKAEIATLKANSNPAATAAVTKAQTMAKTLGYTDADFNEAFLADPVKTMQILAEESAAQAAGNRQQPQNQDLAKQIEDAINAKLTPFQEAQNRQATEAAMVKYEQTLSTLVSADPILKEAPQEVVDVVKDYLGEYFSTQPQILLAMKTKGDFSAMDEAVKFTSGRLHGAFKAWLAKTNGQPSGNQSAQRPNGAAKLTLDDIINDPGVLGSQYKA